jgi:ubiquinone/menaquinone biosynthesis C-methylase UbiE
MAENQVHQKVSAQFAPNAAAYATSPTHSDPGSLALLVDLVRPESGNMVLDVATGAGHTGLAFAPYVDHVVLFDLTPSMLEEAEKLAAAKGIENISTKEGAAEKMPFEDGEFDIVTVRTAPHHFADVPEFLNETYRVLRPGGRFLMVDTTVPEDRKVADEINRIETLRDPSHGRNYSPSEWQEMVEAARFTIQEVQVGMHAGGKKMEVHQWMDRIGTSPTNKEQVLGALMDPTPELVQALDVEKKDGTIWFSLPELTLLATR